MSNLDWLESRGQFRQKKGLERIQALLKRLSDPEKGFQVVLVGGTNGKGSTSRALAAMLQKAGYRTGLFTSPHLERFSQRIVWQNQEIPLADLEDLLGQIRPLADELDASYFEIATALAAVYFQEQGTDWAVFEVGLGGRLDATNALEPELSLITSISLDHTRILGDSPAKIAQEKAGILRPGRPALTTAQGEALETLQREAARLGALIKPVSPPPYQLRSNGIEFQLDGQEFFAPLLGPHQAENLALAACAARELGLEWPLISAGLAQVHHPGRLEYFPELGLLLDGAHNPAGAQALKEALQGHFPGRPVALVIAVSADKDLMAMAAAWSQLPIFATRYHNERSAPLDLLTQVFRARASTPDPLEAVELARDFLPRDGLVVVTGSLYLVGEIRSALTSGSPQLRPI